MGNKSTSNTRDKIHEKLSVLMDHDKIIHISSIMFTSNMILHLMIERVHIHIGKELTSKITNRKTTSGLCMKQTLRVRKSLSISSESFDHMVLCRIVKQYLLYE